MGLAGTTAGASGGAIGGAIANAVRVVAADTTANAAIAFHSRGTCSAGGLIGSGIATDAIVNVDNFITRCGGFLGNPGGVTNFTGTTIAVGVASSQALIGSAIAIHGLTSVTGGTIRPGLEIVG